jgi:cytochrome P450 monooxygenase
MLPESISGDSSLLPDAERFNGLRYYEMRSQNAAEDRKHQYATADKVHLHFGYGNWSCPGRFMASDILKMILAVLLLRYDIKYPDGAQRPKHGYIHEFPMVNVRTPLLMKRRDEVPVV